VRLVALTAATAGGIGYIPFAPGTFGSLAGLALWVVLPFSVFWHLVAIVALSAIGVWSAGAAERHFQASDPAPVVIDEVMGMLITLFLNPVGTSGAVLALLLFRGFDVVKPPPARALERLHGGFGVMADDAMAAVYANLTLRAVVAASQWV
jgi:phosphatidylglycerophosphatase A